jgi:Tol biopolymer transport system component
MRIGASVLVLFAAIATVAPVHAQSFGRNKVHYQRFDFRVLQTDHFDIYYYPAESEAARQIARVGERWYARLSDVFGHSLSERQVVILYASHAHFTETNVIPRLLQEGIGAFMEQERGRIVLPFAAGFGQTDRVLGHELVHAFQRDILQKNRRSMATLPLWFVEGMAEYLAVGRLDPNTLMWLRDAVNTGPLPTIEQLDDPRWFPYRYGQALWAYLAARFGEDVVPESLTTDVRGGALERLAAITSVDAEALSVGWHEWIREQTGPAAEGTTPSLVGTISDAGPMNVAPALSPDGKLLAFLSNRNRYAVSVLIADAATGEIEREILQTATDPHLESLQFIDSSGAWDSQGRRFALGVRSRGTAVVSIFDVETGAFERELEVPGVDQLFNPTWAPDGQRIAFSGLSGGVSDLYELDLQTGQARQLTDDFYADLHPAWSPDGHSIAFSTDRFSSSLETMQFGAFGLALLDITTERVHELPGVAGGKNIDPHWSRDGSGLYFIADAGHSSNVYHLALDSGHLLQITSVATGVSGITALSPALSVAQDTERLGFSVYRDGGYQIQMIDKADSTPVHASLTPQQRPSVSSTGRERATHAASVSHLPDTSEFTDRPYRPVLSLSRNIQPYLSAGGSGNGGFFRAGANLSFSDVLGDHRLETAIQMGKSVDDFVAQAGYFNMRSRWNWGLSGGQVPWTSGEGVSGPFQADGAVVREATRLRQLHRQVSGAALYPFNRTKRLELAAGAHVISVDRRLLRRVYSRTTGQLELEQTTTVPAAPTVVLFESRATLVSDTAVLAPTSPILGSRYRFSIAPTVGQLTFATLTADYRRYVLLGRSATVAMRGLHVGRYGNDVDDPRLMPLVLTLRDIVRGYGDFGPGRTAGYLHATRVVAGSLELRIPMARLLGRPVVAATQRIEALSFFDVGSFWAPSRFDLTSPTLRSAGAGVRLAVAGLVFELDAVRAFDGPEPRWTFAFSFKPGF